MRADRLIKERKGITSMKNLELIKIMGVLASSLIAACTSQIVPFDSHAGSWVGRSIDDLIVGVKRPTSYASRIGWQEKIIQLSNGGFVYVEPIRKDCEINWEVNADRLIVAYRANGQGCYGLR